MEGNVEVTCACLFRIIGGCCCVCFVKPKLTLRARAVCFTAWKQNTSDNDLIPVFVLFQEFETPPSRRPSLFLVRQLCFEVFPTPVQDVQCESCFINLTVSSSLALN